MWERGWGTHGRTALPQPLLSGPCCLASHPWPCAFWPLDDPPAEQTAADLLRGLSGARLRRG